MFQGIPAMMVSGGGSVSAPAGWVERATENFDGHSTGDNQTISGNWTANAGTISYHTTGIGYGNSAVDNLYSYTGASFGANQYSQYTFGASFGGGGSVVGPRLNGPLPLAIC
jgi:hypothetical protein